MILISKCKGASIKQAQFNFKGVLNNEPINDILAAIPAGYSFKEGSNYLVKLEKVKIKDGLMTARIKKSMELT